jgi:hypothetical protein
MVTTEKPKKLVTEKSNLVVVLLAKTHISKTQTENPLVFDFESY